MCGEKAVSLAKSIRLALPVSLLVLDRVLKYFARIKLEKNYLERGESTPLFSFSFLCNEGVAFGFRLNKVLIIFLSILIIFGVLYLMWLRKPDGNERTAWVLIITGALSNLVDRLFWGCVVDYVKIYYWPLFNVADAMLVIAVVYLIFFSFKKSQASEVC